ncbi:PREDICTED: uncharacterized protein LOC108774679 [Cyphomyrmex costatus]|uniref:uncharacterized protein LOC108774679 n=1 Tax=Cyphomyrmex costatus TaxID=456900 RepID=UPI0008522FEE|nr:PREDICTED: uncharacterized protein LOC108774679 [Cyphomyrmex costatus]
MASSKRKTRDRSGKKRITRRMIHSDTRSRVKSVRCKHANTLNQRQLYDSISIPQLVYELLTIDKHNHDARRFSSPKRFETHCRKTQNSDERQKLSYEAVDHCNDSESVQMPEYTMVSRPTSIDSLTEATDAANSSAPTSSTNSSVSNGSMEPNTLANSLNSAKALFRKRSLIQLINSYIKAGVEEGKRQARKYICKALSFGVRSGYLIPTNRQGNMLRVCSTLDTQSWNWRRTDIESRRRRRIARRGKTSNLTTIAERKAMRRGIPRDKFFHNMNNKQTASKRKIRPAQNPAKSLNTRESNSRKSLCKSLHEKSKPKAFTRKNSKINNTNNKQGQQQKRDEGNIKKSIKKRRMTFSAKFAQNDGQPVEQRYENVREKGLNNQYESNEDNYRIKKQKLTSNQEDESRIEKRKIEANINNDRIDYDRVESIRNSNDENNDKTSEKESADHNMSDKVIREMEF